MAVEEEGYAATFSETGGYWYIYRKQMKGAVLHRESQAERFDSEADAQAEIERQKATQR